MTDAAETKNVVANYYGIEILAAPHLSPRMIESMNNGVYEKGEIRTAIKHVREGDNVLEFGAGSGAVGAAIAHNCKPGKVMSFEANPGLVDYARDLYAHNGVQDVMDLKHSVCLSDPEAPDEVTFMIRGNFLGSALASVQQHEKASPVDVPVTRYADLKAAFPHDVIVMDIEGGELDFLRHADLSGVRAVLAELHPKLYGREGKRDCIRALERQGLMLDRESKIQHVFTFLREE